MNSKINNSRVVGMRRRISPKELWDKHPLEEGFLQFVGKARSTIEKILEGRSDKLLVIVGPCAPTDFTHTIEYARRLKTLSEEIGDKIFLVMRVCFQKPRTGNDWPGLSNDPYIDGSFRLSEGYELSWKITREITKIGIPIAMEPVDTYFIHYISKLVSYAWIGARTSSSSEHHHMVSALSMPVGFKNSEEGSTQVAVDAAYKANFAHTFPGIDDEGFPSEVDGKGNPYTHVILRGGRVFSEIDKEPNFVSNYDSGSVSDTSMRLSQKGLRQHLIIDCSHGNSFKDHERQETVFGEVLEQILKRRLAGNSVVVGVMLESYLTEGKQSMPEDPKNIKHDQSLTDSCMSWDTTRLLLEGAYYRLSRKRKYSQPKKKILQEN